MSQMALRRSLYAGERIINLAGLEKGERTWLKDEKELRQRKQRGSGRQARQDSLR